MQKQINQVGDFMKMALQPIGKNEQSVESLESRQLAIKLIFEELMELAEASDCLGTFNSLCTNVINKLNPTPFDGNNVNKKEELDASVDILYVLLGKVNRAGLQSAFRLGFELIHENNMNKAHISKEHCLETVSKKDFKNYSIVERQDFFLLYDENKKLQKPWDHKKVDLSSLIEGQFDLGVEE